MASLPAHKAQGSGRPARVSGTNRGSGVVSGARGNYGGAWGSSGGRDLPGAGEFFIGGGVPWESPENLLLGGSQVPWGCSSGSVGETEETRRKHGVGGCGVSHWVPLESGRDYHRGSEAPPWDPPGRGWRWGFHGKRNEPAEPCWVGTAATGTTGIPRKARTITTRWAGVRRQPGAW